MSGRYVPLDPAGFAYARKLGYIDKDDPPHGNLCLDCGAVVASRSIHDHVHPGEEE